MKEIIEVDGIKLEVIKEEKGIYNMVPFSKENPKQIPVLISKKVVYSLSGKNNYEKFVHSEIYKINGKIFYRTEAKPPYWEFKFIEC